MFESTKSPGPHTLAPTSRLAEFYAANPKELRFTFVREPYTEEPSPYRFHRNSIRHMLALYDCLIAETERVHQLGVTSDEEYASTLQSQVERRHAVVLQILNVPEIYRRDLAAVLDNSLVPGGVVDRFLGNHAEDGGGARAPLVRRGHP